MPTFTTPLKDVLKYLNNDIGLTTPVGPFDTPYPIFDETYRPELNAKIVAHFWNQEIGTETATLFRFNLARKMHEIMPYYNQLYQSQLLALDPLTTTGMQTVGDSSREDRVTSNDTAVSDSTSSANALTINNDFPQTGLNQNDNGDYASTSVESNTSSTSNATATDARIDVTNGTDEQRQTMSGYNVPQSQLLQLYRATFLNIDLSIISDLQELFMSVWDNGDAYTNGRFYS
jgi:hypothetical protein